MGTRINSLLSSQERLAGVRRLAPGTELVREEPAGSGMVVALDRGSAGAEFGEWELPNIREYETHGRGLASTRRSNSRRFKPSRPLKNRSPVLLRRPAAVQSQQAEKRLYREPLTQQLGGQRNPR